MEDREEAPRTPIRRALICVYDKTGIVDLARRLKDAGVEIVSTGATAETLSAAAVEVTTVSTLTGFPECLSGRVKTLHPKIHAGLLADMSDPGQVAELSSLDIEPFDLLVANFYPFAHAVSKGSDIAECVAQIDVGGPAMVRAAAKNHASVAVVVTPADYPLVETAMANGGFTRAQRGELAARAFADVADYDVAVARWSAATLGSDGSGRPAYAGLSARRARSLRYGENPHQEAAVYVDASAPAGLATAAHLHGPELSFNNYVDADAAWRTVHDFPDPAVAVVKHATPCGIGTASRIADAYVLAHECDPVSAYGGIVAANREVTVDLVERLLPVLTHAIVAPSFADDALRVLRTKKSIRVLRPAAYRPPDAEFRQVSGGVLIQTVDRLDAEGDDPSTWQLPAGRQPDEETMRDLRFAWRAIRAVKSNAILLAVRGGTVGIGMGQVNRVDAARLAVARAGDRSQGAAAASDAYFPFPDGLLVLADAGVSAVVAPGGSIRDGDVIAAAKAADLSLYLTTSRHFLH